MKLTDEQARLLQDMRHAIESCSELNNDEYADLNQGVQSLEEAWEEVKRLKEENTTMTILLKSLEWCVYDGPNFDRYSCPSCYHSTDIGHADDCELKQAIDRIQEGMGNV